MLGSCVKARLKASKAFLHSFHSFLTTLFFLFFSPSFLFISIRGVHGVRLSRLSIQLFYTKH